MAFEQTCFESDLLPPIEIMQGTNKLVGGLKNPNQSCLDELLSQARLRQSDVASKIANLDSNDPDYEDRLSELQNLDTELTNLVGVDSNGYSGSVHSQTQSMSDFLSGQVDQFPSGDLGSRLGGFSQANLLENQTLFSTLNAVSSSIQIRSHLCSLDPSNPCDMAEKVMGMMKQAFCSNLFSLANLIQVSSDSDLIDTLQEFIGSIINKIDQAIAGMIDAVLDGIQYGMSKLLKNLMGDDCFSEALSNVVDTPLKEAIGWPGL